jgi:alpha-L-fucosidase
MQSDDKEQQELIARLRVVPRDLTAGASGRYPIGELVHDAADALVQAESDKNWLRAQRDTAEAKLAETKYALETAEARYDEFYKDYIDPNADPSATLHIPEGWRLVPEIVTDDMRREAERWSAYRPHLYVQELWNDMLHAAPSYVKVPE